MNKTPEEILSAESLERTYWGKVIIKAQVKGEFTAAQIEEAEEWQTCACGRLDGAIPRNTLNRSPRDEALANLGEQFYGHVRANDFVMAAATLVLIEQRAAVILTAMHLPDGLKEIAPVLAL